MTLIGSLSASSFKLVAVAVLDTGAFAAFAAFFAAGRSGGSVELSLFRRGFRVVVFFGAGEIVVAWAEAFAFEAARVVRVVAGALLVVAFDRVEARVAVVLALLAIEVEALRKAGQASRSCSLGRAIRTEMVWERNVKNSNKVELTRVRHECRALHVTVISVRHDPLLDQLNACTIS